MKLAIKNLFIIMKLKIMQMLQKVEIQKLNIHILLTQLYHPTHYHNIKIMI